MGEGPERPLEAGLGKPARLRRAELVGGDARLDRRDHRETQKQGGQHEKGDERQRERHAALAAEERGRPVSHRSETSVVNETVLSVDATPVTVTGLYATCTVIWRRRDETTPLQPGGVPQSRIRTWRLKPR